MSAKWRRKKKRRRFPMLKGHNKTGDKKTPRIRRKTYPYRHRRPRSHRGTRYEKLDPLIDVFMEKNEIVVVAGFIGFKREKLGIHVEDQRLTLSAETLDRKYHKSLNLPDRVIPETISTKHKNGVLEIRLEKAHGEKAFDKVTG